MQQLGYLLFYVIIGWEYYYNYDFCQYDMDFGVRVDFFINQNIVDDRNMVIRW